MRFDCCGGRRASRVAWLAGLRDFNKQSFDADEQAPKGGCGRCPKNALWTRKLPKSFKEVFGSTRNAERKGRTPTLDPLCQLAPVVNGWGLSVASTNKSLA